MPLVAPPRIQPGFLLKQFGYKCVVIKDDSETFMFEVYVPMEQDETKNKPRRAFRKLLEEKRSDKEAFGTDESMKDLDLMRENNEFIEEIHQQH